jgi:outer membrane protein OmpA-like peptidoglycan-associated protein
LTSRAGAVLAAALASLVLAPGAEVRVRSTGIRTNARAIDSIARVVVRGSSSLRSGRRVVAMTSVSLVTPSIVTVLFDFDRSAVSTRKQQAAVASAAALVREVAAYMTVYVDGHTDSRGSDAYNQVLGAQRASAVRAALQRLTPTGHVDIIARSFGERRPCTSNRPPDGRDNREGRARNRRVEVYAVPAGVHARPLWLDVPCEP